MSTNLTNSSGGSFGQECSHSLNGMLASSIVVTIQIILVLPPTLSVLHLGIQRWRQKRSSLPAETMSNSDFLTYNLAVTELVAIFSYCIFIFSTRRTSLTYIAHYLGFFTWSVQMILPILICMDRYMAVVRPITYLRVKQAGWIRTRNISICCVWLVGLVGAGFMFMFFFKINNVLMVMPIIGILLIVMTFCSLAPLHILIRPRPGKASGARPQVDPSKQRAVRIIVLIMGVLWLKLGWNLVSALLMSSQVESIRCFASWSTLLFSMPSSLLIPVLFLQRAGKLPKCGQNKESG